MSNILFIGYLFSVEKMLKVMYVQYVHIINGFHEFFGYIPMMDVMRSATDFPNWSEAAVDWNTWKSLCNCKYVEGFWWQRQAIWRLWSTRTFETNEYLLSTFSENSMSFCPYHFWCWLLSWFNRHPPPIYSALALPFIRHADMGELACKIAASKRWNDTMKRSFNCKLYKCV